MRMPRTILTVAGSALVALSTIQFAAASEHHGRTHNRAAVNTQFRSSNAYVAPPVSVQSDGYGYGYYSHGVSAPAGR